MQIPILSLIIICFGVLSPAVSPAQEESTEQGQRPNPGVGTQPLTPETYLMSLSEKTTERLLPMIAKPLIASGHIDQAMRIMAKTSLPPVVKSSHYAGQYYDWNSGIVALLAQNNEFDEAIKVAKMYDKSPNYYVKAMLEIACHMAARGEKENALKAITNAIEISSQQKQLKRIETRILCSYLLKKNENTKLALKQIQLAVNSLRTIDLKQDKELVSEVEVIAQRLFECLLFLDQTDQAVDIVFSFKGNWADQSLKIMTEQLIRSGKKEKACQLLGAILKFDAQKNQANSSQPKSNGPNESDQLYFQSGELAGLYVAIESEENIKKCIDALEALKKKMSGELAGPEKREFMAGYSEYLLTAARTLIRYKTSETDSKLLDLSYDAFLNSLSKESQLDESQLEASLAQLVVQEFIDLYQALGKIEKAEQIHQKFSCSSESQFLLMSPLPIQIPDVHLADIQLIASLKQQKFGRNEMAIATLDKVLKRITETRDLRENKGKLDKDFCLASLILVQSGKIEKATSIGGHIVNAKLKSDLEEWINVKREHEDPKFGATRKHDRMKKSVESADFKEIRHRSQLHSLKVYAQFQSAIGKRKSALQTLERAVNIAQGLKPAVRQSTSAGELLEISDAFYEIDAMDQGLNCLKLALQASPTPYEALTIKVQLATLPAEKEEREKYADSLRAWEISEPNLGKSYRPMSDAGFIHDGYSSRLKKAFTKEEEALAKKILSRYDKWQKAKFPLGLNGNWHNAKGTWIYGITKSNEIRNSNRLYQIVKTESDGKVFKVIAKLNDRFFTFYFSIVDKNTIRACRNMNGETPKGVPIGFATLDEASKAEPNPLKSFERRKPKLNPRRQNQSGNKAT